MARKRKTNLKKVKRTKRQIGGTQKIRDITNYTPMPKQPVKKKPTKPVAKKPPQPSAPRQRQDIVAPGTKTGRPAISNATRRGAGPTPPEGKLKQVDLNKITPNFNNLNSNKLLTEKELKALNASKPISKAQKELNARMEREIELQNMAGKTINIGRDALRSENPQTRVTDTLARYTMVRPLPGKPLPDEAVGMPVPPGQPPAKGGVDPSFLDFYNNQPQTSFPQQPPQGAKPAGIQTQAQVIVPEGEPAYDDRDLDYGERRGGSAYDRGTIPTPTPAPTPAPSPTPTPPPGVEPTPVVTPTDLATQQAEARARAEQLIADYEANKLSPEDLKQVDPNIAAQLQTMGTVAPVGLVEAVAPQAAQVVKAPDVERVDLPEKIAARGYTAALAGAPKEVTAAIGNLSDEALAEIEKATLSNPTQAASIAQQEMEKVLAPEVRGKIRPESLVEAIQKKQAVEMEQVAAPEVTTRIAEIISDKQKTDILQNVTGEGVNLEDIPQFNVIANRTAQVAEANTRIARELGDVPSEDAATREAITSDGVAKGNAVQIGGVPTIQAAQRQAVTGEARKTAAADMLAVVAEMPPEVSAVLMEDPASVEAQIDAQPVNVQAATAALPPEALVSVQMENLLSGIEDGKIPVWARPAVDAVNQMLAQRGMTASSVGQVALFNAIIQEGRQLAFANAQAIQQRASQNLSNEQQANLQEASQVMQQRMANLANRQTAASQTAQMAQEVNIRQAEFEQQAVLTTAQQQQQTRLQNLQNEQQRASQESAQRQQAAIANLDTGTRIDLANLEQLNAAGRENLSAEQQVRLTEYQAKVSRQDRQAELNQRMEEANLDASLKVELSNLSELNATNRAAMSNEQQMRLANLNVLVDFKKTNASLAQQMDLANMSAQNQMELAMLQERAAADSANFTAANQFRLQELTTAASVLSQNAELRQKAEFAKLGAEEKIALANLTAKNQADSESMTAQNQAELADLNKRMRVAEVNANLAQQLGLAELSFEQNRAMTNAQINANMDMANFNAEQQRALANSKFMQTATLTNLSNEQQAIMQDATAMASLDLANLDARTKLAVQNAQAFLQMDMANLNNQQQANMLSAQQEQQRLLSDQAAQNAARQFNATSENQTNQFMASLGQQAQIFNASEVNKNAQFNAQQENARNAMVFQVEADLEKANAAMANEINKFNTQIDFNREQFNIQQANAIEQSNVAWRRQANTVNTAAENAVMQQNAQNAFGLSSQAMSFLWQELRDQADYDFRRSEGAANREAQLYATAIANEANGAQNWGTMTSQIGTLISTLFGGNK